MILSLILAAIFCLPAVIPVWWVAFRRPDFHRVQLGTMLLLLSLLVSQSLMMAALWNGWWWCALLVPVVGIPWFRHKITLLYPMLAVRALMFWSLMLGEISFIMLTLLSVSFSSEAALVIPPYAFLCVFSLAWCCVRFRRRRNNQDQISDSELFARLEMNGTRAFSREDLTRRERVRMISLYEEMLRTAKKKR